MSNFFQMLSYQGVATDFSDALKRQITPFIRPVAILGIITWLPFIEADMALYPDIPFLVYTRVGFTVISLAVLLLSFITYFKKKPVMLLLTQGFYMFTAVGLQLGLVRADPVYAPSLLVVVFGMVVLPIRKRYSYSLVLCVTLTTAIGLYLNNVDISNFAIRFTLIGLTTSTIFACIFIFITDKNRKVSYAKSKKIENQNLVMRNELELARHIQETLLPPTLEINDRLALSALYKPMIEVGGDFYDFIPLEKNRLGFFIADVSGHGVGAAMISTMVKSFMSIYARQGVSPDEVLQGINNRLFPLMSGHFVTSIYGVLDTESNTFSFSSAGHLPIIHQSHKSVRLVKPKGKAIGVTKDIENKVETLQLELGDRLYLFTDGITEVTNTNRVFYGEQHLAEMLVNWKDYEIKEIFSHLLKDLYSFSHSSEFEDDLTIMGAEVCIAKA